MKRAECISIAGLLVVVFGLLVRCCVIADSTDGPSREMISAALRNQLTACGRSLEVKYTYAQDKGGSGGFDIRYVRTPDRRFIELKSKSGYSELNSFDVRTNEFRQLTSCPSSGTPAGLIASGLFGNGILGTQTVHDPILLPLGTRTLLEAVADARVVGTEEVNQFRCWRLEVPPDSNAPDVAGYVVWLDATIGFCPRRVRIDFRDQDSKPKIIDFSAYEQIAPGVWFPKVITYRTQVQLGEEAARTDITIRSEISEVHVDKAFSSSELAVSFPSGTQVRDNIIDAEYTVN